MLKLNGILDTDHKEAGLSVLSDDEYAGFCYLCINGRRVVRVFYFPRSMPFEVARGMVRDEADLLTTRILARRIARLKDMADKYRLGWYR